MKRSPRPGHAAASAVETRGVIGPPRGLCGYETSRFLAALD